ncbi:MAG TPA: nitrous oxide reductase family maturation protein NosD, partial [Candidatus Eisenbacteria bacterium]|nr:nitrous oxide reductase family maturation protein NosD [Candidatus Eisenbacteria bacterium]
GRHPGPVAIAVANVTLLGGPGVAIVGRGTGSVVAITAPGVRVAECEVRGSGGDVMQIDAGVRLVNAPGARFAGLVIHDVLYGIAAERSPDLVAERCDLTGRVWGAGDADQMEAAFGNGIHLWASPGAVLSGNRVRRFEDAIYLSFADHVVARGNVIEDNGRYGFHTMYCQGTAIDSNVFRRDLAGSAIMFSNHLAVRGNRIEHNRGPRTYGLLLRDCSDGVFEDNQLLDNTVALFLDNSNRNRIAGNLVEDNGWGVLLYSSCAGNVFTGNSFVNDDYPVALDMRRTDNAFDDGRRGNYWSAAASYDLNGDGVGDVPYSPVSAFAFVSKQYPDLTVLSESPAVAALGVAERVIPALQPSEAVDHFPLVSPPLARRARTSGAARASHRAQALAAAGFGGVLAFGAWGIASPWRHA